MNIYIYNIYICIHVYIHIDSRSVRDSVPPFQSPFKLVLTPVVTMKKRKLFFAERGHALGLTRGLVSFLLDK